MTGTTLCRLTVGIGEALLHPVEHLLGLRKGLVSNSLFGGHWGRDSLAQSRGFITGRVEWMTLQLRPARYFRMGAATSDLLIDKSDRRIIGTVIARAVRLETAAKKG